MIRRRALCVRRLGGGIELVMGWGVAHGCGIDSVVLGCGFFGAPGSFFGASLGCVLLCGLFFT